MKRVLFAIVIVTSIGGSAQTATNPASLQQTLIAQTQAVAQAQKSKDGDTLKRLLTDDFQHVGSEGRLHDKDEFIGDAKDGKLTDYRLYNLRFLPIDDNAAIVTCDSVIHATEGDNILVPHYQHLSFVWVKQADQWRLRFAQATAKRPVD
jgi:uncharacterized protein (TIGR02246 family)